MLCYVSDVLVVGMMFVLELSSDEKSIPVYHFKEGQLRSFICLQDDCVDHGENRAFAFME